MQVRATTDAPLDTGADTVVVGLFDGKGVPHDLPDGSLQALVDAGEARSGFKKLAVAHGEGRRWILVGLGARDELDLERARVAAAVAYGRAKELGAKSLCWELPHKVDDETAGALVEGTAMAAYEFTAYKKSDANGLGELIVSAHHDVTEPVERAAVVAEATALTRDLQNLASNDKTPAKLAGRARELAAELGLDCEVLGREQIRAAGMGAFSAVAQGSVEDPALITLRYEPDGARGPVLGLVGKAVTFDTGGISIKPADGMDRMKDDMSGGAAVVCAMRAISLLRASIKVVGVVPATENMPGGRAIKPGDVLTGASGKTVEVLNTDAEGRLILGDGLWYAQRLGATHLIDVATLTGACVVALGKAASGLFGQPDAWVDVVRRTAARAGDRAWPMPLYEDYADQLRSEIADMVNTGGRPAGACTAAMFLKEFAGGLPWAHLDIAGTAWAEEAKPWQPKGATGVAVRTLAELAFTSADWK